MKILKTAMLGLAILAGTAGAAQAGKLGFGPTISTLGVGGEIGYRFNHFLGVRAVGSIMNYDVLAKGNDLLGSDFWFTFTAKEDEDMRLAVMPDFLSAGIVLDWYPVGGLLRLTAGMRYQENSLYFRVDAYEEEEAFGGYTSRTPVDLQGIVTWRNRYAPYGAIGLDISPFPFLDLVAEFGLLYQGKLHLDLWSESIPQEDVDLMAWHLRTNMEQARGEGEPLFFLEFLPAITVSALLRF